MRCSAPPTTCSVIAPREAAQQAAREVAGAVLFREILKPLARGLGPVGEAAVDAVADALFVRKRR